MVVEVVADSLDLSIFVGPNGTPTRKSGITWSSPPLDVSVTFPFVVAVLSDVVEVFICSLSGDLIVVQVGGGNRAIYSVFCRRQLMIYSVFIVDC